MTKKEISRTLTWNQRRSQVLSVFSVCRKVLSVVKDVVYFLPNGC